MIDSNVIVLALLVLAWMEGVHPFLAHSASRLTEFTLLLNILVWLNAISGVLLMLSVFFFFLASLSKIDLDRSTLWIFGGATCFFAIHLFRTYSVYNLWWDHISASWLIVNGTLTLLTVAFISTGILRRGTIVSEEHDDAQPKLSSRQRMASLWIPYGVALVVALILTIREINPINPMGSGLLPIVLLMTAIVSRQMLIMWDNLKLSAQLTKSNLNLEQNVTERTNHLATLHSITSTLNSTLDRQTVLNIALGACRT